MRVSTTKDPDPGSTSASSLASDRRTFCSCNARRSDPGDTSLRRSSQGRTVTRSAPPQDCGSHLTRCPQRIVAKATNGECSRRRDGVQGHSTCIGGVCAERHREPGNDLSGSTKLGDLAQKMRTNCELEPRSGPEGLSSRLPLCERTPAGRSRVAPIHQRGHRQQRGARVPSSSVEPSPTIPPPAWQPLRKRFPPRPRYPTTWWQC